MPVEAVELVDRSHVKEFLHFLLIEEVAADVEVVAAMMQDGSILNDQLRHRPGSVGFGIAAVDGSGHQLTKGLKAVEEAAVV